MTTEQFQIPRFDFSGNEMTDEQLDEELAKSGTGGGGKFFEPGKYDVSIDNVEFTGMAKNDPTWCNVAVTLKAGEKETKSYLLVPTSSLKYGAKATMFPFKTLKSFCGALGVELKASNVADTMKTLFARPEKLKGAVLSVTIGYTKGYVKYVGKDAEGKIYHLHTRDGNPVCDMNQVPLRFLDGAAAKEYAKTNGIEVEFPRVKEFAPAATGSGLKLMDANW